MNKSNKIDLHELYKIKETREIRNTKVFNHILDKCYKKIKEIAEHGGMSLYYKIPPIIIGYPIYDFNKCLEYIIKHLKKSGLYVGNLPYPNNNYIYISWKIEDISQNTKYKLLE